MAVNADPKKQADETLFSYKKKNVKHPLSFNGSPLARVDDQKHLGLILPPSLSFVNRINEKNEEKKERDRNYLAVK